MNWQLISWIHFRKSWNTPWCPVQRRQLILKNGGRGETAVLLQNPGCKTPSFGRGCQNFDLCDLSFTFIFSWDVTEFLICKDRVYFRF